MAEMTNAFENDVVNHFLRNAAVTSPSAVYLHAFSANPGESGAGTEVAGGSYAPQAITFGAPSNGTASNTNTITFTNMPSVTVDAWVISRDNTSPAASDLLMYDDVNVVVGTGNNVVFDPGDVTVSFD